MDVDLMLYFLIQTDYNEKAIEFVHFFKKICIICANICTVKKVRYFNRLSMISACRPGDAAPARME